MKDVHNPEFFPVLGTGMQVPFRAVLRHQSQAVANHGQSVHGLAARGGLDWRELYAVLSDVPYTEKIAALSINVVRKHAMRIIDRESAPTAQLAEGQTAMAASGCYVRQVPRYE